MIHYTFRIYRGYTCFLLYIGIQILFFSHSILAQKVETGIDVLQATSFSALHGKKIGIITNPTGVNKNLESTIDLLDSCSDVNVKVLFSPEHGIRGDHAAGETVGNYIDKKTGLTVYSLYGKQKKPTAKMLEGLDALVYDIQDIGVRSYTYISSMGLVMEACAENNVEFIVLDRPNPMGGVKVEGGLVDADEVSFVSQFPIPYIYGLTCGELATYLNQEKLLKNGISCQLQVIKMKGWKRNMTFEDTRLPWVPTSPHIPNSKSAIYYAASGILGELYTISIGVGYTQPFELFAAEWINADKLAHNLNQLKIPGVLFRPVHYKPYYSVGKGTLLHGVQLHFTDFQKAPISLIQFYVMQECHQLYPNKNPFSICSPSRLKMFDRVCGSKKIRAEFTKKFRVEDIEELWEVPQSFIETSQKYYLYPSIK